MDVKIAALKILKTFPGQEILGCYEYDKNYYLFSISPKGKITNEDNFYLINKNTGVIKEYPILKDIKKFNSIINDKTKILNFK